MSFLFNSLLASCDQESRARLMAAGSSESGAWLQAPPISSLRLRMSNDTVRGAVGLRIGAPLCQPHQCNTCGKDVDQFGRHGLSCRYSHGRMPRHQAINNIIFHSLTAANVPSRLEPSGLFRADGKRPDGVSMVHRGSISFGMQPAWTHFALQTSSTLPRFQVVQPQVPRKPKFEIICPLRPCVPVSTHCSGDLRYLGPGFTTFLKELERRLRRATGEPKSYSFLLQRLSVAIQIGNAASIMGSIPVSLEVSGDYCF